MSGKGDALAHRILKCKGRGSGRSEVDYATMKMSFARRKRASVVAATRVKELKAQEHRVAELQLLRLHKLIWHLHLTRFEAERLRVEHSLEESVRLLDALEVDPSAPTPLTQLMDDHLDRIFEYEAALHRKVNAAATAAARAAALAAEPPSGESEPDAVLGREQSRRAALDELKRLADLVDSEMVKLNARAARIAAELEVFAETPTDGRVGGERGEAEPPGVGGGGGHAGGPRPIQRRALEGLQECPDEELRLSLEAEQVEFWRDAERRVLALDESYRHVVASGLTCGWPVDDHAWFLKVEAEYLESRAESACKEANTTLRQLMLERMLLERPHLSRAALVDHEAKVSARRFYDTQRAGALRGVAAEWAQFEVHAQAALAEAAVLEARKATAAEERAEFDRVRLGLKERLLRWKRDQLAAAHEAERTRVAEAHRTAEWEAHETARVAAERRVLKEKLKLFHDDRARAAALAESHARRRAELEARQAAETAAVNATRVDFRRQEREHRLAQAQLKAELEAEEAAARERRLERLRALVEVTAAPDPERARGPTAASQAAAAAAEAHRDGIAARRGEVRSFEHHGYTRDALDRDQRTKVELALRAQGLVHTDYARDVLRRLPPPTQPRRGLESSLFKPE
eukprot:m.19321 g.19321  ORF g.19321 m.19321 type:complete len:636 (+) comp5428_c0_seq1:186-2093(+)